MKSSIAFRIAIALPAILLIAAATSLTAQQNVTLKVWDQFESVGMTAAGPAVEKIHAEWAKAHPNVKIDRSVFGGGFPIRNAVELALKSGEAPDVFYSWPSGAGLTVYARAGYLTDLTPYADKYGWKSRLPDWGIARNSNAGKLYAYPWEQDLEFIYYNKRLFSELKIDVPKNWEDVNAWVKAAKQKGLIPIALGNQELWPAVNIFSDLTALCGGRQVGLDLLQGRQKWNSAEPQDALQRMVELAKDGAFSPGFNGTSYNDSLLQFYSGKATAVWTGTWVIHDVVRNMPEGELGIFYFPQIYPNKPQATHMSEGSAYYIWSGSKNKDLAAEYINFVTDPKWLNIWIKEGYTIPIQRDPIDFSQMGVNKLIADAFSQVWQ
jgi:raffinose/stachyose/melibiose transport system substrate-binding protein